LDLRPIQAFRLKSGTNGRILLGTSGGGEVEIVASLVIRGGEVVRAAGVAGLCAGA